MMINKTSCVYLRKLIPLILFVYMSTDISAQNHVYSYVNLNVRSAPSVSEKSPILAVMSIGDSAQVISEKGNWYEVIYGDISGYIYKSYAGESYMPTPSLESLFKENWMSYIISINTEEKLFVTIEDWGFCGPSDQSEMHLVIYNYKKGEVVERIILPVVKSVMDSYYDKKYQEMINSLWLFESRLIQKTLHKYGFETLYADKDSLCEKIDPHTQACQVVTDSLNFHTYKWLGIDKIMHKGNEVWNSHKMVKEGNHPTSTVSYMMINNECLLLGVKYTTEADCDFFERVAIPVETDHDSSKINQ